MAWRCLQILAKQTLTILKQYLLGIGNVILKRQISCCRRKAADLHLQRVSAEALRAKLSKAGSKKPRIAESILHLWKGGKQAELKAGWSIWNKYTQTCKVSAHIH